MKTDIALYHANIFRTLANRMALKFAANTEAALAGPVGPVGAEVGPVGADAGPVGAKLGATGAEVEAVGATLYGSHRLSWQQASSQWSRIPVVFTRVHAVKTESKYHECCLGGGRGRGRGTVRAIREKGKVK